MKSLILGLFVGVLLSGCGKGGPSGLDGKSIEVVELCPQSVIVPLRPASIAFCLDGNLYVNYSSVSGFSGLLRPGFYRSGGFTNTCQLTVAPECKVLVN